MIFLIYIFLLSSNPWFWSVKFVISVKIIFWASTSSAGSVRMASVLKGKCSHGKCLRMATIGIATVSKWQLLHGKCQIWITRNIFSKNLIHEVFFQKLENDLLVSCILEFFFRYNTIGIIEFYRALSGRYSKTEI